MQLFFTDSLCCIDQKKHWCKGKKLDSVAGLNYNLPMIEKMMRIGRLYDFYSSLLTEHQRKCIEMHYMQDLSLGEIASELGVSRQAVNDILRRTEESMVQYEASLQLLMHEKEQDEILQQAHDLITQAITKEHPANELLRRALTELDRIHK